jgi:chromosome segregation ATPase
MANKQHWLAGLVKGVFGQRIYLILAAVVNVKVNQPLENATKVGSQMAEEALAEIRRTIAEVTGKIGEFNAHLSANETRLKNLTGELATAQRVLDRAVEEYDVARSTSKYDPDALADLEANVATLADNVAALEELVERQTGIVGRLTKGMADAKKRLRHEERKLQKLQSDLHLAQTEAETARALEALNDLTFGTDDTSVVQEFVDGANRKFLTATATGELANDSVQNVLEQSLQGDRAQQAIERSRARRAGALPPSSGVDMTSITERHREKA